jgi:hypothetical protein
MVMIHPKSNQLDNLNSIKQYHHLINRNCHKIRNKNYYKKHLDILVAKIVKRIINNL